jgi:hypothetical protein
VREAEEIVLTADFADDADNYSRHNSPVLSAISEISAVINPVSAAFHPIRADSWPFVDNFRRRRRSNPASPPHVNSCSHSRTLDRRMLWYILIFVIFQWDEDNVAHISEHGISPEEAEYVARHAAPPFPRAGGDGKFMVWGRTEDGSYLQVGFVRLPDERVDIMRLGVQQIMDFQAGAKVLYVFHAMPMTADQKRQYRKLKGR